MQQHSSLIIEIKTNTRLRLGIWLIFIILGSYTIELLSKHEYQVKDDFNHARLKLAKIKTILSQKNWDTLSVQAKDTQIAIEDKLWLADNKGLALANFQAWVDLKLRAAKLPNTRITVESSPVQEHQLLRVAAKISGTFVTKPMIDFLLSLALHPQWVIVETLNIRKKNTQSGFSLVLISYFQLPLQK